MADPQTNPMRDQGATENTCTCGHPEREHSQCNGECYLCACKRYTQAAKIEPSESKLLAQVYRYMLSWWRLSTKPNREQTGDKDTES